MKNTIMLYTATLEFETTLFVNRFDKDFEEMLSHLDGCPTKVGQYHRISHKVDITDSPVIPENEFIEEIRVGLFENMKKFFEGRADINATVEKTEFAGIMNLKTRKVEKRDGN